MLTMTSSTSQYKDLNDFLANHASSKNEIKTKPTHTRIASTQYNVYGGAYTIQQEELETFHSLYYEHIFRKGRKEYLTEAQIENGPILIDFDFRYSYDVTERLHTIDHITDIIQLYLNELKEMLIITPNTNFPIFVMEKPHINRVAENEITKDGIHILIGIQMNHTLQIMLRDRIINQIGDVIELPITNTWDKVLDDGISKGHTNWQLYGSQKPGNEAYKLSYCINAKYDENDNDWMTTIKRPTADIDLKTFRLMSAQYDKHIQFEINENIKTEYEQMLEKKAKQKKASSNKMKINMVCDETETENFDLNSITNIDILKKAIDTIMCNLKPKERYIQDTHEYTQILPEKYYEPGSHLLNRKVAFALKHTDERLFLSWVMLRSKASDFDYATIPNLYEQWKRFNKKENGITSKSITYWAIKDAFEDYKRIQLNTVDYLLEQSIYESGEWDYANVLHALYGDKFICVSIKEKKWQVFKGHRWEEDEGQLLRSYISTELYTLYSDKISQCLQMCQNYDNQSEQHEKIQKKIKKISEICVKLKKTQDKNNIMREACEIFYDGSFIKNANANPYLLCFENGVYDFKAKEFRRGYPHDYITKTTGINYTKPDDFDINTVNEINDFMKKLFPEEDLYEYMWAHLASTLIGIKSEQVFTIYLGSGSNGKTMLVELMSKCLGEYKGVVPINLLTDKRSAIGSHTPELMSLKDLRLGVGQELSVGLSMNEGIVKELTGGDPIIGRDLFSKSETFKLQLSLVLCTNTLFEIKSNDDGTWRRMKIVKFKSKFVSPGEIHTDDTKFVFPKDKSLNGKLPLWASTFMSMLIEVLNITNGEVKDCPQVVEESNKYRQSQDAISAFINDKIVVTENKSGLSQTSLSCALKDWYQINFGNRKPPKLADVIEIIVKKYGNRNGKTNKWHNIKIREEESEQYDDVDDL